MTKKQTNNQIMTAIQFPLKLSFACTAHKMQDVTVSKPNSLVLDLRHILEPAQANIMLSRVQALNQLSQEKKLILLQMPLWNCVDWLNKATMK